MRKKGIEHEVCGFMGRILRAFLLTVGAWAFTLSKGVMVIVQLLYLA